MVLAWSKKKKKQRIVQVLLDKGSTAALLDRNFVLKHKIPMIKRVMARSSTQLPTNTYTINASACLLAAYAYLFTLMDFYALLMLLTFAACLCTSSHAYGFLCLFMHTYVCYLFAYGS
jgi:hypothetical protein